MRSEAGEHLIDRGRIGQREDHDRRPSRFVQGGPQWNARDQVSGEGRPVPAADLIAYCLQRASNGPTHQAEPDHTNRFCHLTLRFIWMLRSMDWKPDSAGYAQNPCTEEGAERKLSDEVVHNVGRGFAVRNTCIPCEIAQQIPTKIANPDDPRSHQNHRSVVIVLPSLFLLCPWEALLP
jgi:hypothetical protein